MPCAFGFPSPPSRLRTLTSFSLCSYSFLDIGPLSKGHALVIPKCPPLSHTLNLALADKRCALGTDHAPKLHDVPDEHLGEILATLKKIAVAQGVENYNILQVSRTLIFRVGGCMDSQRAML